MCGGDSVEYGVIRGNPLVNGVFDGRGRVPLGNIGRNGGMTVRVRFTIRPVEHRVVRVSC